MLLLKEMPKSKKVKVGLFSGKQLKLSEFVPGLFPKKKNEKTVEKPWIASSSFAEERSERAAKLRE